MGARAGGPNELAYVGIRGRSHLEKCNFRPTATHGSRAAYRPYRVRRGAAGRNFAVTCSCGVTSNDARDARPPPARAPAPAGRCGAAFGDDLTQRLVGGAGAPRGRITRDLTKPHKYDPTKPATARAASPHVRRTIRLDTLTIRHYVTRRPHTPRTGRSQAAAQVGQWIRHVPRW